MSLRISQYTILSGGLTNFMMMYFLPSVDSTPQNEVYRDHHAISKQIAREDGVGFSCVGDFKYPFYESGSNDNHLLT